LTAIKHADDKSSAAALVPRETGSGRRRRIAYNPGFSAEIPMTLFIHFPSAG